MPLISVNSLEDLRLRAYQDLPHKRDVEKRGLFIAEGMFVVQRLIRSSLETESILVSSGRADEIAALTHEDVPIYVVERPLLDSIVGFSFHRGVLACGKRPLMENTPQMRFRDPSKSHLVVACVNVNDQENLGGILRNCAAFGVDQVLLSADCADPYARRVLRVSMGTALDLPIAKSERVMKWVGELRSKSEFQIVGAVLDDDSRSLTEVSRFPRMILVVGNEANGIGDSWKALCDVKVRIPICDTVDSLNVSVATGILLYHVR